MAVTKRRPSEVRIERLIGSLDGGTADEALRQSHRIMEEARAAREKRQAQKVTASGSPRQWYDRPMPADWKLSAEEWDWHCFRNKPRGKGSR